MLRLAIAVILSAPLAAAPLQILAIGDSLTEEYAFEFPFSAPASRPLFGSANISNWPEIIQAIRPGEATLGIPYESQIGGYSDLRDGGFTRNFGVPGFTTADWTELLETDTLPIDIFDPGYLRRLALYRTREVLVDELPFADVAVIFLGGNDLKQDYDTIFTDSEDVSFFPSIVERLRLIHDFIFSRHPDLPIVVCTIPDVGATPQIYSTFNDPVRAATTRAKIAGLNQDIVDMVATENAKPGHDVDSVVARIDTLTDLTRDLVPFHLNGTTFTVEGNPENTPDRIFARDDFHPSTVAQALITNEIITAINQTTDQQIPLLSNREILGDILGLDPDQPFLDWVAPFDLTDPSMTGDPDQDGLATILEMGLGSAPDEFSKPFTGTWHPDIGLSWTSDPTAARYLSLTAEESTTLETWSPLPEERINRTGNHVTGFPPPDYRHHFIRLRAVPLD